MVTPRGRGRMRARARPHAAAPPRATAGASPRTLSARGDLGEAMGCCRRSPQGFSSLSTPMQGQISGDPSPPHCLGGLAVDSSTRKRRATWMGSVYSSSGPGVGKTFPKVLGKDGERSPKTAVLPNLMKLSFPSHRNHFLSFLADPRAVYSANSLVFSRFRSRNTHKLWVSPDHLSLVRLLSGPSCLPMRVNLL